jgi:hypothetical protein
MQLLDLLIDVTLACTDPISRPLNIHTILAQQVHDTVMVAPQERNARVVPSNLACSAQLNDKRLRRFLTTQTCQQLRRWLELPHNCKHCYHSMPHAEPPAASMEYSSQFAQNYHQQQLKSPSYKAHVVPCSQRLQTLVTGQELHLQTVSCAAWLFGPCW